MVKARGQAEQYARALPNDEGWPPFLIVVDVGHTIELFADFTKSGKTYLPFPDPGSFRIPLDKLANSEQREKLRLVWTDPLSLDPSRRSAKVTRELADRLAKLAKSLEASKYEAGRVAQFLMRCLFTMFAEDVDLIPRDSFKTLLESLRSEVHNFPDMVRELWSAMDKGTFSPILRQKLRRFNGGLFEDCEALPLTATQLELLIDASKAQWRDVEPAIFGTLLERAHDPVERHKLGAHFTPRAYVERLVLPTIIEPLREQWDAVRAAALALATRGETKDAIDLVRDFHRKLCETRVLDPACGTGNFLYVALEHMKRLEGEVLNLLRDLGYLQTEFITVDPHQFHGIEVNPRAAAIADLVLWIGYLQWHLRTRDLSQLHEPIIQKFHNIECRDAVLAWDAVEPVKDEHGQPVTRWDGRTMKPHPVTGEDVPDDTARVPVVKYINPRKADWPEADYVVGNPPFVGSQFMLEALGSGYTSTLRQTYFGEVPESADFVIYWWNKAAELVGRGSVCRAGLITTNSLKQTFNSRIVQKHLEASSPISILYAIPDHPWVDSTDGAAVRISMTVFGAGSNQPGCLQSVTSETTSGQLETEVALSAANGVIAPNLRLGATTHRTIDLKANLSLSFMGVKLVGEDFIVDADKVAELASDPGLIRPFLNGRDVTQSPRNTFVIDTFGVGVDELRARAPSIYQHLFDRVKPQREARCGKSKDADEYAARWWQHAKPRPDMRASLAGLPRFVATSEVSKHRTFVFVDAKTLADGALIVVALSDAYFLGTLSSRLHVVWSLAAGGRMGVGNDPRYNKTRCFDPFPFPVPTPAQQARIRDLAEQLDAHRKRQQALHPGLTMTGMYNVLEKLRSGETLTDKEKTIHEQGLVSVLKQIHDELDAAVFDAYGWPVTLTDEEILERLVALNAERAAEEERGLIRWLRPDFQNRSQQTQQAIDIEDSSDEEAATTKQPAKAKEPAKKLPLPEKLPEQVLAIRQQLATASKPLTAADMAKLFTRAKADRIEELLQSLVILGSARQVDGNKFVAA